MNGSNQIVPSTHQQAILDWLRQDTGHGCINAVAGSGKSTTLFLAALQLEAMGIKIADVKVIVFGKANAADLIAKFGDRWKGSISTLHSAGWRLVKEHFQKHNLKLDSKKYDAIASELKLIRSKGDIGYGSLVRSSAIAKDAEGEFVRLLDLARLTCTESTAKDLEELAEHHELNGLFDFKKIAKEVGRCLKIGMSQAETAGIFDFSDQIYYPYKLGLKPRQPYKFVLVDECQDLNTAQLELAKSLAGNTGRILAVGDPCQAIFGFAGADNRSYQKIVEGLGARELPLSVCYRCPTSHVWLVNQIFSQIPIVPRSDAAAGKIDVIESEELSNILKYGDLVICRKTAPLVSLCIKLIGRGIAATVKGRDIGAQIAKELKTIVKVDVYTDYTSLGLALRRYEQLQSLKFTGLKNEEQMRSNLEDRCNAIESIYTAHPECQSIEELHQAIEKLFSDNESPITLATAHRTKGLEAERIFLYQADDLPFRWRDQLPWQLEQEYNLLYVALTRSKQELYLIPQLDKAGAQKSIAWLPDDLSLIQTPPEEPIADSPSAEQVKKTSKSKLKTAKKADAVFLEVPSKAIEPQVIAPTAEESLVTIAPGEIDFANSPTQIPGRRDAEIVEEYAQKMRNALANSQGNRLDAISVWNFDKEDSFPILFLAPDGTRWIADGHKTIEAATLANVALKVQQRRGTMLEAKLYSFRIANRFHGQRIDNAQKRAIVGETLKDREILAQISLFFGGRADGIPSDRAIAEYLQDVSFWLVQEVGEELRATGNYPWLAVDAKVGRDGKTQKTASKSNKAKSDVPTAAVEAIAPLNIQPTLPQVTVGAPEAIERVQELSPQLESVSVPPQPMRTTKAQRSARIDELVQESVTLLLEKISQEIGWSDDGHLDRQELTKQIARTIKSELLLDNSHFAR